MLCMKNFVVLFVLLLFLTSAFALEEIAPTKGTTFDRNSTLTPIADIPVTTTNTKFYDAVTKTVTVKTSSYADIATIKLLTPLNNLVGAGYQKVAEFEVNSKVTYTDFLKEMYFYNLKNNNAPIKRGYDLRIPVEYVVKEDIIEYTNCDENKMQQAMDSGVQEVKFADYCTVKKTGTRDVSKVRYDLLTEKNFSATKKNVSIWTTVEIGDSVEWIPVLFGVPVQEWAAWNYSLNTGIVAWYDMNAAAGANNEFDKTGNGYTMTQHSSPGSAAGIINNSRTGDGAADYFDNNTTMSKTYIEGTLSGWVYTATVQQGIVVGNQGLNSSYAGTFALRNQHHVSNKIVQSYTGYGTGLLTCEGTTGGMADNTWYFLTVSFKNDGNVYVYVNGNKENTCSFAGKSMGTRSNYWSTHVLKDSSGTNLDYYAGRIDEVGIWTRQLTDAEVTNLYNAGAGQTFQPLTYKKIDLNVYRSGTSTHLSTVGVDCNDNTYDLTNQTSPFSETAITGTAISCAFSRTGYDSNTQILIFDSNKTQVIYLSDTTAPSVGNTTTSGFTIAGSTISGTGNIIGGTASDTGSDLNTSSCEYTVDNGANWYPASYTAVGGKHCYYNGYTILGAGPYNFKTRISDNAGNVSTTGSAAGPYTGDITEPTTSISGCTAGWHGTNQTITLTCNGNGYTCLDTNYTVDGGAVTKYTAPFTPNLDKNYAITYFSNSNYPAIELTKTSYCAVDKTPPTTTFSGATGSWQGTTLSITLTCADTSGSGCATTYYRINSSGAYSTYSAPFGVSDGNNKIDYYSIDNIGNTETSKTNYAAQDKTPPTTSMTQTYFNDSNTSTITLVCTDTYVGCATTSYRINSGAWTAYTTDFNYSNKGIQLIDFNSTDTLGNSGLDYNVDLNMPIYLTIAKPKNIATLATITEKWILQSVGGVIVNLTDLTASQSLYVQPNVITTFYIGDVNGNYTQNIYSKSYYDDTNNGTTDTLQPYLYNIGTSLSTTFNILNKNTLAPLAGYTIKFYGNLPGIGYTLIGQGISDDKGQILQLFIASQAYVLEVYDSTGTLLGTFNYTAINNQAYIYYNFLSIYIANLPPVTPVDNSDLNTPINEFFVLRNTLFTTCSGQDACFPTALIAIILTIVCLITATSITSATGSFIGIKGLSVISFICFTIFFGIGFLPLFIYAFLGTITLLMAVLTQ